MSVHLFGAEATGHADPDDPELVTIAWSVREGILIEDVTVFEGTMLSMRVRVPMDMRRPEEPT